MTRIDSPVPYFELQFLSSVFNHDVLYDINIMQTGGRVSKKAALSFSFRALSKNNHWQVLHLLSWFTGRQTFTLTQSFGVKWLRAFHRDSEFQKRLFCVFFLQGALE